MKRNVVLYRMLIALVLLCVVFSCSKEEDRRKYMKSMYGEPDFIESGQYGSYKIEFWVYGRTDVNRAVEFRKTESGCSGSSEWYIYQMYYADYLDYSLYVMPVMTHEPVVEAPPAQALEMSLTVNDPDNLLDRFDLWYRGSNQTEFTSVMMTPNPNDHDEYLATIPADALSGLSLDYYLDMTYTSTAYEKTHVIRTPKSKNYTIKLTAAASKVSFGPAETSPAPHDMKGLDGLMKGAAPLAP